MCREGQIRILVISVGIKDELQARSLSQRGFVNSLFNYSFPSHSAEASQTAFNPLSPDVLLRPGVAKQAVQVSSELAD